MSIKSEIDRISGQVSTQSDLIAQIKTALDGKAAGGGVEIKNQDKTIIANGTYTADSGYTGLGTVTVNVSSGSTVKVRRVRITGDALTGVCYQNGTVVKTGTSTGIYICSTPSLFVVKYTAGASCISGVSSVYHHYGTIDDLRVFLIEDGTSMVGIEVSTNHGGGAN